MTGQPRTHGLEAPASGSAAFRTTGAVAVIAFVITVVRGAPIEGVPLAVGAGLLAAIVAGGLHAAAGAIRRAWSRRAGRPAVR